MLKSHERFHSANGKRLILIADDEFINREILRGVLQDEYELIFAKDGEEALYLIRENRDALSLVLLDLMMPNVNGFEVLKIAKADPEIALIPIIVLTSDQEAEVESLTYGASDFIPKPYPQAGVIMARILRTIELSEDRQIIRSTERDMLTGLYNREYFYRYAEQFDQHHKEMAMDAIVVDVNHFHMINERFGTAYGDSVLRRVGETLRESVIDVGGIVCRRQADTFLVYCPSGKDYAQILERATSVFETDKNAAEARVWLRMGVYANVDKRLDIERRFDRAKMAADTVHGNLTNNIAVYDITLHDKELYSEQLVDDFATALKEHQFKVHFQPKFDIRPEIPVLASAEALVRWQHPRLGLISPGVFIPLFEDNGLIQQLDMYVWHETAASIRNWKERFGFAVPVSVNVSRIDMYDPHLVDELLSIVSENGLETSDLYLEITESAYTQDSDQMISTVMRLRNLGFKVEMDDFGTGYSSLNMISRLPIDALKLDMQFIRNAFNERGDTRLIEVIIDIADYLGVPVIAEGVETREQLIALRKMGCAYVQGFYFSRPVPAEEYEHFVIERIEIDGSDNPAYQVPEDSIAGADDTFGQIAHALTSGFEVIYYVDVKTNHYVEFSSHGMRDNLQIESSGDDFFVDVVGRIVELVHPDDQMRVELSLQKDTLLEQLPGDDPFFMTYRMVVVGVPVFYSLKAVRSRMNDDQRLVIGLSNVDAQMKQVEADSGENNELNFASLAKALSSDVESIYYIDVLSGSYMEFGTEGYYKSLKLQLSGMDFFEECKNNIKEVVFPDDREKLYRILDRDALLAALRERSVFTTLYRLVINGEPLFYRLKAVWAEGSDGRHVIIGVSNVDAQLTEEERRVVQRYSNITRTNIVDALASDYICLYYVDTETDKFVEYSSDAQYQALDIDRRGLDFFECMRSNVQRVVHPDDVDLFLEAFTKEQVLAELESGKAFTMTYRLMLADKPTFVHLKAIRMVDEHDSHIVVGFTDVDAQVRREKAHDRAVREANQDALTGVKSKRAYEAVERKFDQNIQDGNQDPFALVICDVNDLGLINEKWGRNVGDRYIKDACWIVCDAFKHSPVFRIDGGEFAAILMGADFEARSQLMTDLEGANHASGVGEGALVACGIAEFDAASDTALKAVFERAESAMKANKAKVKEHAV